VYRNVVIAYDGSEGAKAALARAAEVAKRDGASLTLVEAVSGKVPSPAPGGPPLAQPEKRAMARKDLNEAIEHVDPDLLASGWVIGGPPGKGILTVSRDRGGITSTVLGSVSTEILHGAHCDVLVVHPEPGQPD
jgi:nucleotide-binding universal stress UspA family protein